TAVLPAMLVFAVGFLLHLLQQAQLSRGSMFRLGAVLAVALVYPLLNQMVLVRQGAASPARAGAGALGPRMPQEDAARSERAWLVAWYADRPSIWMPVTDGKIPEVRKRFSGARWLFATAQVRDFSPDWRATFDTLLRWNLQDNQARAAGKPGMPAFRISGKGV